MNKKGPIIIIEDDLDDQEVLRDVFSSLEYENEVVFFSDAEKALNFLTRAEIDPFLILSDINMPRFTGGQLRKQIQEDENGKLKSIPFLFFTTSAEQKFVVESYSKSVQGFFIKPSDFREIRETIHIMVEYWLRCVSPN